MSLAGDRVSNFESTPWSEEPLPGINYVLNYGSSSQDPAGGRQPVSSSTSQLRVRSYPNNAEKSTKGNSAEQQTSDSYTISDASNCYTSANLDHTAVGSDESYDQISDHQSRYIGAQDIQGQGVCHVYEDGKQIPIEIDGEAVNPQWGLTKANKPRKRLPLACLQCRAKKVKCEPSPTGCSGCNKAGNTRCSLIPNSSPAQITSTEEAVSKREAQVECAAHISAVKRQKSMLPVASNHTNSQVRQFGESIDPMKVDPRLVTILFEKYFSLFNNGIYNLFPRKTFMRFAIEERPKTKAELMVVHAMLAVASIHDHNVHDKVGKTFLQLAEKALSNSQGCFSIQVSHTQLLLALYHHSVLAQGRKGLPWVLCGNAMRTLSALNYNHESICTAPTDGSTREVYGLSPYQIIECRRRSLWCGSMSDCYVGFGAGMLCTVKKTDIYLPLPCSEVTYSQGAGPSEAPFYDNGVTDRSKTILTARSPVSSMAHLILITEIWSEITAFAYQSVDRSPADYATAYEDFRADTLQRLQKWSDRLPDYLQYSEANMLRSLRKGYGGDFIHIHIYYHYCELKLNRWMRLSSQSDHIDRNITAAHQSAHCVLDITATLAELLDEGEAPQFSTPFVVSALHSAVDVASVGGVYGTLDATNDKIEASISAFRRLDLGSRWKGISDLLASCEARVTALDQNEASVSCWLVHRETPMDDEQNKSNDVIYGVDDEILRRVFTTMSSGNPKFSLEQ